MTAKKRRRKWWLWALLVLVVLAIVVAVVARTRTEDLLAVTTETIERRRLVAKVTANGRIDAQRRVDLSANVPGQIVNLAVREGDRVEAGDFLLQIDQAQLAATARGAAASLEALFHDRDAARAAAVEAERRFARAKRSFGEELIPESDLDSARAAVDSAEARVAAIEQRIAEARANLAGARDTLSKTKIVAPMAGVVTRLPVEEGEVAVIGTMNNPGTVLMTISDMSVVEAVMEVDETDIPQVELGHRAEVRIDAYGDRVFAGLVTEVASSPIETAGGEAINFEVKIQLSDPPPTVRPGFSCSADIVTGTRDDVVATPIQSLVVRDSPEEGSGGAEQEGVYLLDGASSTVRFAAVETGITGDTRVEVLSGVTAGDVVVTGPFRALRELEDGDEVRLEEEGERQES